MRLETATWIEVETYLKQSDVLLLPIGSTEQHGPTGLLGTDFLTAKAIAQGVGEKLHVMVAPPLCYGMAAHHMAFSGSASLKPSTYQLVLTEVLASFYHHGFRRFHLVNGHGGNEPSVRAAFQELKAQGLKGASFALHNWWKLPAVTALAEGLYGEKEGFHATPSEVSVTFYLERLAARPYHPSRAAVGTSFEQASWPLTAEEVREVFPDGAMKSDPGLAHPEHGERFFKIAVDAIVSLVGEGRRG